MLLGAVLADSDMYPAGSLALDSLAHHPRVGESTQRPDSLMPMRLPFLVASVSGSVFLHVLLIFHSGIVN